MSTHKTMELSDSPPAIAGRTFPEKLRLSVGLQEEFLQWIELVPPQRTLRHLRKMLFAWMLREQSGFPTDFEEMITDLDCLFELLDSIQDQMTEEWESRQFEKEKMRGGANMNDENMDEKHMNEQDLDKAEMNEEEMNEEEMNE